jgi:alkylation response protein AidB-like acyl-CoA dehydrogenase
MNFAFSKEEEAFRQEVREWLKAEIPPRWSEIRPGMWEETEESWAMALEFERKMGEKGWLAANYPQEYGGINATFMQQFIINEERAALGAPLTGNNMVAQWVGPTLLLYGTEQQKRKYMTGIAKAEMVFCLGYSEPGAGSDLAGVQTRAVEDGDDFVINGQKIFTTLGHHADYCFLVARTDPNVPKHKGISLFIVDMKTSGITVRPLINIARSHHFNEVFFDDVRVPREDLVGEKNQGWTYLTTALNFERSGIALPTGMKETIAELARYAKTTSGDGGKLADDPIVQQKLAELATENEVLRLLCYRVAWLQNKGLVPSWEASVSFLYGSEVLRHIARTGMEILGLYGQLKRGSKWVPLRGAIENLYLGSLVLGIGGGSNEIQRSLIARLGLGLPRG